jgi:predicted pyridoxine 5'-phosphate oxidase superfamily flavin-nucleotide-binding protein
MSYKENEAQNKYSTIEQASSILNSIDTTCISNHVKSVINNCSYFFLATASKEAHPNMNFKGGDKGFVHVVNKNTIIFPDLIGNGILHGINDIMQNPNVAMLFIDFITGVRYKVNGLATIIDNTEEVNKYLDFTGFDYPTRIIKVNVNYVIGNCSKSIDNVRKEIIDYEANWESPCGT